MATPNRIQGDMIVTGQLIPGSIAMPANSVGNAQIPNSTTSPIDAEKSEQQHAVPFSQAAGAAIVAESRNVLIVRGATGELVSVDAMVDTIATGADRTVTIDVKKGNSGAAFATMLTATIVFNNVSTAKAISAGTLVGSPTLADGDILRIEVTVAGAAGAQAQGLNVTLHVREKADP